MREMQIHNKGCAMQFEDTSYIGGENLMHLRYKCVGGGRKYFGILEYFVITRLIFAYTFFFLFLIMSK